MCVYENAHEIHSDQYNLSMTLGLKSEVYKPVVSKITISHTVFKLGYILYGITKREIRKTKERERETNFN